MTASENYIKQKLWMGGWQIICLCGGEGVETNHSEHLWNIVV